MKKQLILFGHLSLITTAILALYFYKERVLYVDPGQQLFEMINTGGYKTYVSRYSMYINQTIPLMAIRLGLSLRTIMIAYSLSFVVVYYTCFLISVYKFKNITAGLCIAFAPLLIRIMFGHSIAETWLGIGYSTLFFAALQYKDYIQAPLQWRRIPYYLLLLALVVLNYFMHPVTLFFLGYAIAYTCIINKAYIKAWPYLLSLFVLALYSYKFFFTTYAYEESFFNGLKDAPKYAGQLFQLPVILFFIKCFRETYICFTLFFVLGIAGCIWKRKYILALFIIGYTALYLVIATLAFHDHPGPMLAEARLLPLIFMALIPATDLLQGLKKNYLTGAAILCVLGFSYVQLYKAVKMHHTSRLEFYASLLEETRQYPERKFYAFKQPCWQSKANSWGIAVETLMLTSLEGKENGRTIYFFPGGTVPDPTFMQRGCNFLWVDWWTYYSEDFFNKKYFDLGCRPYREIHNPECETK